MPHPSSALIRLTQNKFSNNAAIDVVLNKRQLHATIVRAAATKTFVRRVRR
jgi:hypothetical protein